MITYSQKLEALRLEVLGELNHQCPTKHDAVDFLPEDEEERDDGYWREDVPMINIRHKHGYYSTEHITGLKNIKGEVHVTTEDTETNDDNTYPIEWLSTGELCEVLDYCLQIVIENKK